MLATGDVKCKSTPEAQTGDSKPVPRSITTNDLQKPVTIFTTPISVKPTDVEIKTKPSTSTDISSALAGTKTYTRDLNLKLTNVSEPKNDSEKAPGFWTMLQGYCYTRGHREIDDEDRSFKKLPHDVQKYIKLKASECGAKSMA